MEQNKVLIDCRDVLFMVVKRSFRRAGASRSFWRRRAQPLNRPVVASSSGGGKLEGSVCPMEGPDPGIQPDFSAKASSFPCVPPILPALRMRIRLRIYTQAVSAARSVATRIRNARPT